MPKIFPMYGKQTTQLVLFKNQDTFTYRIVNLVS